MKKLIVIVILIFLFVVSCSGTTGDGNTKYEVSCVDPQYYGIVVNFQAYSSYGQYEFDELETGDHYRVSVDRCIVKTLSN